jgi:hypothetical protein
VGLTCSVYMEMRNLYRHDAPKTSGKSPLGRPRSRWKDNSYRILSALTCSLTYLLTYLLRGARYYLKS